MKNLINLTNQEISTINGGLNTAATSVLWFLASFTITTTIIGLYYLNRSTSIKKDYFQALLNINIAKKK